MPLVHSKAAIVDLLRRGIVPTTDNENALVDLGFEPASPQLAKTPEACIWERSVEHSHRAAGGDRLMIRERAFLQREPRVTA